MGGLSRSTVGNPWDKICAEAYSKTLNAITDETKVVVTSYSWGFQLGVSKFIGSDEKPNIENIAHALILLGQSIPNGRLVVIGNLPSPGLNLYEMLTRP